MAHLNKHYQNPERIQSFRYPVSVQKVGRRLRDPPDAQRERDGDRGN